MLQEYTASLGTVDRLPDGCVLKFHNIIPAHGKCCLPAAGRSRRETRVRLAKEVKSAGRGSGGRGGDQVEEPTGPFDLDGGGGASHRWHIPGGTVKAAKANPGYSLVRHRNRTDPCYPLLSYIPFDLSEGA